MIDKIIIKGARENNLKNVDIDIPKNKLVVITGVSGSGKSSLAFDTIYTEGKRRYFESLSSYARQFLGGSDKADVESIEGLSPTIAVDQKSTSHNPRSTVGTVTEIYDYLRVLFARVGTPYCPYNHGVIVAHTQKQMLEFVLKQEARKKLMILAPIPSNEFSDIDELVADLKQEGYLRIRVNNQQYLLDEYINIPKAKKYKVEIILDRVIINHDQQTKSRISDSIEQAIKRSNGEIIFVIEDQDFAFSQTESCQVCGFRINQIEPSLFSFNSPLGACETCKGLGYNNLPDERKMIPNPEKSINQGGIDFFKNTVNTTNLDWQRFNSLIVHYQIDKNKPLKDLSKEQIRLLMYGSDEPISIDITSANNKKYSSVDRVEGILELVHRRYQETSSEMAREHYNKYLSEQECETCSGKKLSPQALSILINKKDIIDFTRLNINEEIDFLLNLSLNNEEQQIANPIIKEILDRLGFLKNVGLDYLTLARSSMTLSGGESQRIRLATQIGSKLTGILYVLDEPSIGLHQKDNEMLIHTLKEMRDLGNTLIVVEHDEDTMLAADYLIDVGPGAGVYGGEIIAFGTPQDVINNPDSITGQYLSKKKFIPVPAKRRGGNGAKVILKGASHNNLKNVNLTIPLNKFICVTGVSGSGKSSLIFETLVKAIEATNFNPFVIPGKYSSLIGANHIDKIVVVSQEPIGRTSRSNPATYVGVFDDIRSVFEQTPQAKERGYSKSRFSFNVKGGRCERCQGDGMIRIGMHFLPDVYVTCEDCLGKRYNDETLEVKYKGKSIYDVLKMPIDEALLFFQYFPGIHRKLQLLVDVGLGYLELGADSTTISGGEAQRIKLAKFLQRKPTGKTLFVLDEPTTGLHMEDIAKLISILNKIVDNGDTVLVIEHNLDLIKVADHIIDIGPNGGSNGGEIIATGTPEQLINKKDISYTARYLEKYLNK
ncbi:excinuclease ABC subunit UvrA [Ureaplasma diversum]|uniref:UvrABC system protein A n=1 Tax=Ureaplasma diversum NCTC 246 TaxID=1188241 RepID=A0A084EYB0_9BACT|nr:excinuclease ABC subunit UvrA [Ureaplasma diversum]KEZ22952.1 Excinuclease ABC subunit A [Ureaplasma diversum NCTC 246]